MNRDENVLIGEFAPDAKQAVYDVIALRRDIRSFRPDPVPEPALRRVLDAAHRAASVGLMQPWDFILLRNPERKAVVYELFRRATELAARRYEGDRRAAYGALKLQGILDAPLCICITCDTTRGGPHVLGRDSIPETDRYSTCLAVQNLWLAARAEGLGVGWVSIVDNDQLARALELPSHVVPIAFLCVGYPVEFPDNPMLETTGWRGRLSLDALIHEERWGDPTPGDGDAAASAARLGNVQPETLVDVAARSIRAVAALIVEPDPSDERASRVRRRLDALAMPVGSLGAIERLAIRLAVAQRRDVPAADHRHVLVFAGDHGVTAEGVSAFRPQVTARLCYNMLTGGAVVNAFLRLDPGARLTVVDVGVDHEFDPDARLRIAKVRRGTENVANRAAMSCADAERAIEAGIAAVNDVVNLDILVLGEVGIGNTTAASALLAMLTGMSADDVVGAGTGVGDRARARKTSAIAAAIARDHSRKTPDAIASLANAGGLEIGALVGAIIAASARRVPVVLDGFITGVAAMVAARIAPFTTHYLIASHRSAERAHGIVLRHLGLAPLLELDLRLGEASGGVLALPLVRAACALLTDVRTFEEAGIDPPIDDRGST